MVLRNKKGSLDDLVYIIGILLFFALIILFWGKITDEFNTSIQGMNIADNAKTGVSQINDLYGGVIDNSFLFLTIGLAIVAVIFAMLVVVHPVFFVFYFIFLTIVIFVAGVMSNIYQEAAANPELSTIASKLVFTSHVLEFLPFITGVLGFILAIIMYKTWQER